MSSGFYEGDLIYACYDPGRIQNARATHRVLGVISKMDPSVFSKYDVSLLVEPIFKGDSPFMMPVKYARHADEDDAVSRLGRLS